MRQTQCTLSINWCNRALTMIKNPSHKQEGVRCKRFKVTARREEEEYPHGYLSDEHRCSGLKNLQPFGLSNGRSLTALLLSRRAPRLYSFVAPCQRLAITQRTPSYL
jgi:hypothetical protein